MVERITALEEKTKSNTARINKQEEELKNITQIGLSIKEITIEIKCIREDMLDFINRIKELENLPKTRWNDMIKTIITVVVTSITTFILIKLGIK